MADAGRVVAGSARGIRLAAPGRGTRPLGDRVKEALFAIIEPRLRDASMLDLFAGSGAGGIEALSRGAARVVFVEGDAEAARVVARNLERTHLAGPAAVVRRTDALAYLRGRAATDGPFDLALVDPPYAETDLLTTALQLLGRERGPMAPDGIVVAKHAWRAGPPERVGLLASERERRFGETMLTFYRVADRPVPLEAAPAEA